MQTISGDAIAMYDEKKLEWCYNYQKELRNLQLQKFDEVTAKIMEYMDVHTKMSEEEKKNENSGKMARKG